MKQPYIRKRKLIDTLLSLFTGYVEHRKYEGLSGFLPFYRIGCTKHGWQITYPHGYEKRLECPLCIKER